MDSGFEVIKDYARQIILLKGDGLEDRSTDFVALC